MKLGAYTACLHDRPVPDMLEVLADLGLESAEINSGGFLPPVHIPVDDILSSDGAGEQYLGHFEEAGIELTALNCNGNPLNPHPEIGPKQADDLRRSIEVAGRLGVKRVIAMSGLPGSDPDAKFPNWVVNPWGSQWLDILEWQWDSVAVPFWREVDRQARDADVKVCLEMHPHNVVFNPATLERLVEKTGATHVGAEMDPSHLFWQRMDPIAVIERLGDLVFFAAAKDLAIYDENARVHGVLDERHVRVPESEERLNLGGPNWLNRWPENPAWEFVAVGRGHEVEWWTRFLQALHRIDPDMAVNIEHEDTSLETMEGLRMAAENLQAAYDRADI